MARTNEKVSPPPSGRFRVYTPESAATTIDDGLALIRRRWKLVILFQLFDKGTLRYSEFERAIPGITQKMLSQQLRALENDGILGRTIYPEVPPRVEYFLTEFGASLCPALNGLLQWIESKPTD